MGVGIGATVPTLSNGTTADGPTVGNALASLNSNGVSNDGGAISTNGSGTMTLPGVTITSELTLIQGTLSRVGLYSGVGNATITHNWGVTPDAAMLTYSGAFGSPPTQGPAYYNLTTTQASVNAQSGYTWRMFLIKL